jgi:hypothetical protein
LLWNCRLAWATAHQRAGGVRTKTYCIWYDRSIAVKIEPRENSPRLPSCWPSRRARASPGPAETTCRKQQSRDDGGEGPQGPCRPQQAPIPCYSLHRSVDNLRTTAEICVRFLQVNSTARLGKRPYSGNLPAKLPDTRDFSSRERPVRPDCVRHHPALTNSGGFRI